MARARAQQARFQNGDLCRLTEQVIFSDPYRAAKINRHRAPMSLFSIGIISLEPLKGLWVWRAPGRSRRASRTATSAA